MIIAMLLLLITSLVAVLMTCADVTLRSEALVGIGVLVIMLCREIREVRAMRHRADAFQRWAMTCYDASVPFAVEEGHIQDLTLHTATVFPHLADRR